LFGEAVSYTLNQWEILGNFLEIAGATPDNNAVLCSGYYNPQDSGKSPRRYDDSQLAA